MQNSIFTRIRSFLLLSLVLFSFPLKAQRFFSVVFDQLPKDMQMYARGANNLAEIPVSGIIEIPGWSHMSVVTYRNGQRYGYQRSTLNYGGKDSSNFSMKTTIKAEKADYTVDVWACRQADSVLMVRRTDVVAGDFYLINGQSNGAALMFDSWNDKYCRTIARIPDNDPIRTPGDTLWIPSSWSHPYVGAWGVHLQRLILEKYGIPTTIINASLPGAKISYFLQRNESNHADPNNLYGSLLHRTNVARPKTIKGYFWYQGEQEAIENIPGYESAFDQLYHYWRQDLLNVENFYIIQTNIIYSPVSPSIRDYQRRTKYLYEKTDHFSTLGLELYDDGVHYLLDAYKELARRIFYFLEPRHYGVEFNPEVDCPDVQKIFYSTSSKDEITLVFQPGQRMEWPKDSTIKGENGADVVISNKDFFFFDGDFSQKAKITAGKAEGNRIILSLDKGVNAGKLTYLPLEKPANVPVLRGPYIRNSRKLGIFSFADVSIGSALGTPSLSLTGNESGIRIAWQTVAGADSYVIEKKSGNSPFVKLTESNGTTTSFTDTNVLPNTSYTYRVYAVNATAESAFAVADMIFSPVLGSEPAHSAGFAISPNPVREDVNIEFSGLQTGRISLRTIAGLTLFSGTLQSTDRYSIPCRQLSSGIYFITFESEEGTVVTRKFIR